MDRGKKNEEIRRSVQVVILLCYTLYSLGLIIASIANKWEFWAIPILFIGAATSWSIYISGQFVFRFRVFVYAGFISLATFFYGSHISEIYNATLIIVVAMLLFALTEEKAALRILAMTYALLFVYHALLLIFKSEDFSSIKPSVILLHVMVIVLSDRVAGYLCEMLVISQSISEELEKQLRDMKQKSEDFMANISHELRTPINVVTGLSGILLNDEKNGKKRADLHAIQGAGRRLFSRIEDIMDYTEIDTGSLVLAEDDYRISSIVNDIATDFRGSFTGEVPELIIDMDVSVPARMIGDAAKIKRIIRHLVVNAVKFTDDIGGISLKVFTRKKEYGVNLCIEVTDNGIGMSADEMDKVRMGMYQIDSGRSRKAEGIGLGLSIVYGFVKLMGGFVLLESKEKKGTKVTVSIPQKVADERASVTLDHPEKLEMAVYLRNDKYKSPAIREYYGHMIMNCLKGLNVPIHKLGNVEELKKICTEGQITHVFIAEEEYNDDREFYENIKSDISVIAAVSPGFVIPEGGKVTFVRKPVFSHSLVNAVNRKMAVWEFDPETSGKKLMFKNVKALIVDDEEMNLLVAKGILAGYGMDAEVVRSGIEAVRVCEQKKFDVIFMDHMMPEMDGVEAMKLIRKNAGSDDHAAIVAFTANAVSGAREMFLKEGFDEFLPKPIENSELERILKKLLPSTMWEYVTIEKEEEEKVVTQRSSMSGKFNVLNADEGRRLCRGSSAFYEEVLREFDRGADTFVKELEELYTRKDWVNYGIKLDGLKLSARIIGADDLSRKAQDIEKAAMDKWEAYIIANHDAVRQEIDAVRDDIYRVYGGDAS